MTSLSPDPNADVVRLLETIAAQNTLREASGAGPDAPSFRPPSNAVITNCFLTSSLAASVLVAAGAVTAKQWLSHQSRDAIGAPEAQGRFKHRRREIIDQWHFRGVIKVLPLVLQLSVVAFLVGFSQYLRSLNAAVAYSAISVILAGLAAYVILLCIAVALPECPFQTPITRLISLTLRGAGRRLRMWLISSNTSGAQFDRAEPDETHEATALDTSAVAWVIEEWDDHTALLAAAQTVPSLAHFDRAAGRPLPVLDRLQFLFLQALSKVASDPTHYRPDGTRPLTHVEPAIAYGRALLHWSLGTNRLKDMRTAFSHAKIQWPRWVRGSEPSSGESEAPGRQVNELRLLLLCLSGEGIDDFCESHAKGDLPTDTAGFLIYIAALLEPQVWRAKPAHAGKDRVQLVCWLIERCLATSSTSLRSIAVCAWAVTQVPFIGTGIPAMDGGARNVWWSTYTRCVRSALSPS